MKRLSQKKLDELSEDEYADFEKEEQEIELNIFKNRLEYIRRIFEYDKILGCDVIEAKINKYYWGDLFDQLYYKNIKELEWYDQKMQQIVKAWEQSNIY